MILYSGKTFGDTGDYQAWGDYQACSSLKDKNYLILFAGEKSIGICFFSPCNATIMNALKP